MKFRQALKLHSGDEVSLKSTGEVGVVMAIRPGEKARSLMLDVLFPSNGFSTVTHPEVG